MLASTIATVLLACLRIQSAVAYKDPWKFLIVSDARNGSIAYMPVVDGAPRDNAKMATLIPQSSALVHPQGLAVDQARSRLYIADPDLKKIIRYHLHHDSGKLKVEGQKTIADNVEVRWVTLDSIGNLYFSDEANNKIMRVDAQDVQDGNATVQVWYDTSHALISAPGGIITDNFKLYWTNKIQGDMAGVIISAPVNKDEGDVIPTTALSKNIEKAYGACLVKNHIYYTAPEESLFAVDRGGGDPVTISSSLGNPRGCAWDGEGTMYIADRGTNSIMSFSAPQELLQEVQMQKVADFSDAFGVAVFSGASRLGAVYILGGSLLSFLMALALQDF
mmetsp:Transcript_137325/g.238748  ORF Transcript_137325/g.238748 Transcript_137325/m.238748 type:complete len:334 (-) Transcript_137325:22-1023(-)